MVWNSLNTSRLSFYKRDPVATCKSKEIGLPLEVLQEIFLFTSSYTPPIALPPVLSDFPWVLGRVCSRWRLLSRSIPVLWTACESVYFGRRQGVLAPYTEEEALKHLTLATTILPQVAVIRVSADSHYPNDRIPTRALSPLLPQVSELAWHIDHPAAHLESLSGLAPSSLSLLKTLSITLQESDIIHAKTLRAKLFGDSPNLRDLHVICQYPVLLYPDFTWVHLQSLSLSTTNRPASSLIKNSWLELVDPKPMVSLPALKKLTLRSQSDICSIIIRLNFPWKQLTSIDIYWSDHPHGIPALLEPLSQCESLVSLRIENYGDPPSDTIYDDDNPITLPSLRYLNVWTAVPIFMVKSLASSGTIHALDAGALPLADFYIIIAQCPNLKILHCQIEVDKRTPIKKDTIILHHLTSLTLFFEEDYEWSAFSFPTLLAAPMLSFLKVRVQAQVGTFPLDMTAHLITRSEARLSHLNLTMNMTHAIEDQLAGSLLAILSTLENCDSVHLVGLAPPQSVLDLIASRRLLPHVTSLTFSALSDDDLLSTMEGRLRCERESGHVRLRRIRGCLEDSLFGTPNRSRIDASIREIGQRYNVDCSRQSLLIE